MKNNCRRLKSFRFDAGRTGLILQSITDSIIILESIIYVGIKEG